MSRKAGKQGPMVFKEPDVSPATRAERALKQSEARYRHLVESSNDWVWEVDAEATYIFVGPQCREILGYEPEELLGKKPFDLMPAEEARRVAEVFGAVAGARKPFRTLQNINYHKSGRLVILETNGVPIFDELGTFLGYRGMDRDITDRKRIEQDLRKSEERLRLALDANSEGVWDWDIPSGRAFFSQCYSGMLGYEPEEFPKDYVGWKELVHPEDFERVNQAHAAHIHEGKEFCVEFRMRKKAGDWCWIRSRGIVIERDTEGGAIRMVGTHLDITDRRRAEEAVRESEQRFRLVANTAPVMIWMCDPGKLCTYCNQPWLEFTGRSLEQELGNGWTEGIHADDLERCFDTFTRAFDRRESFQVEYRYRRHDGQYRWLLDRGVPRFNPDGSFAGYIGSSIDVTDRKLAEDALSTVSRRLIEAHEEERTWLARELHDDVNQRLAILAVTLDVVKRDLPAAATGARQSIGQVNQQVKDLGIDVQALSHRLHSSKLEYLGLVAAAGAFCKEFSERQEVQIEFQSEAVPKALPTETSLCLFRVLQEALQNAAKHSGSRHFHVSLTGTSDEIHLTVRDSGVGFDVEEAMRGRGLGIASMRERLKLVDGELSIDSQTQKGTEVHASVPLSPGSKSAGG
jgi:PAS domain S-box-containing protein